MNSRILVSIVFLSAFSIANEIGKEEHNSAIKQTQDALKDPAFIKEETSKNSAAKAVDKNVQELAGSDDNAREMYAISADILPVLMEMNKDNPEKALESLNSYGKNPEEFLKSLPADIRARIEKLSKKIENNKGKPNKKD